MKSKTLTIALIVMLIACIAVLGTILITERHLSNDNDNSNLQQTINNKQDAISSLTSQINDLEREVADLEVAIKGLFTQAELDVIQSNLNTANSQLAVLKNAISAITDSEGGASAQSQLDWISDELTSLRADLSAMTALTNDRLIEIYNLNKIIDELEDEIDELLKQTASMFTQTEMDAITNQLTTLQGAIALIAQEKGGETAISQLEWIKQELADLRQEIVRLQALLYVPYIHSLQDGIYFLTLDAARNYWWDMVRIQQIYTRTYKARAEFDTAYDIEQPSDILEFAVDWLEELLSANSPPSWLPNADFFDDTIIFESISQFWNVFDIMIVRTAAQNLFGNDFKMQPAFNSFQEALDYLRIFIDATEAYRQSLSTVYFIIDEGKIGLDDNWSTLTYRGNYYIFIMNNINFTLVHNNGIINLTSLESHGDLYFLNQLEMQLARNATINRISTPVISLDEENGHLTVPPSLSGLWDVYVKGFDETEFVRTNLGNETYLKNILPPVSGEYRIAVRMRARYSLGFYSNGRILINLHSHLSNYIIINVEVEETLLPPTGFNSWDNFTANFNWDSEPDVVWTVYYRYSVPEEWLLLTRNNPIKYTSVSMQLHWYPDNQGGAVPIWMFGCCCQAVNIRWQEGMHFAVRAIRQQPILFEGVLTFEKSPFSDFIELNPLQNN